MPRMMRRISTVVYGLGIVGALAFGVNQALARAVYSSCPYHFPMLGACTGSPPADSLDCVARCNNYNGGGGDYWFSRCTEPGHCCVCLS